MNIKKPSKANPDQDQGGPVDSINSVHLPSGNIKKTATQLPRKISSGGGKNSSTYWLKRVFKQANSRGEISPHYAMRVSFKGRRVKFSLGTADKAAASLLAAAVYNDLLTLGLEATLAKRRSVGETEQEKAVARVGEWIEAARKVSGANASTFNCYACSLRKIVGDILAVKRSSKRFGPRLGGARDYREMVDAASLDVLSQASVQAWRLAYVKRAKNPAQERSRMTSCNSTIRQARSLFAGKVVKYVEDLRLPQPPPFHEVEFFPRQSAKYFSKIDPRKLLQDANESLAQSDPPAFLAMLLALSAGLRRGEIDSLCWHQIDFERQLIRVESTDKASLKTADSRAEVPIDENVVAILRGFRAKAVSVYVIEAMGGQGGQKKWGQHYRADAVFNRLTDWLRGQGVTARKPLHELRKELGALVTAEHGIYAASRVLRHSDVSTTARHYSDLKTRPVVNIGGWISNPETVVSIAKQSEIIGNNTGSERIKPEQNRA
jgi:integrase